jgi:hypothetical protein
VRTKIRNCSPDRNAVPARLAEAIDRVVASALGSWRRLVQSPAHQLRRFGARHVLPDADNCPTECLQDVVRLPVSLAVAPQLLLPPISSPLSVALCGPDMIAKSSRLRTPATFRSREGDVYRPPAHTRYGIATLNR